ncbi:hypothetical protein [Microbacterium sp. A93]|uniref:hypothetical protein n=1 Tax=Microbacterium sp. A93 TaxID=3450716 RepID=UPI003F42D5D5
MGNLPPATGMNEPEPQIDAASTKALAFFGALYWRKSWFGPGCPPAILFCRSGYLRLETHSEVLFDVPISEVQVKLTIFKTLKLTVQGRHYALVGSAGVASRGLSCEQLATLVAMSGTPQAWPVNSSEPALYAKVDTSVGQNRLNFAANGSTIRAIARGGAASFTLMQRWSSLLVAQGAQMAP